MAKRADALDLDQDFEDFLGEAGLRTVMDWVAAKSLWVHPEVVAGVPVVFPLTRRKRHDERRGDIVDGVRLGTNVPAQHAFWYARGEDWKDYKRTYVCHLYDASPYLPDHNTHLANLCVFPRGIQSMSEWAPIQAVLQWHAWKLYAYAGPTGDAPPEPPYYPREWKGVGRHTGEEVETILRRLRHLRDTRPMHTNPADASAAAMGEVQRAVLDVLRESPNGLTQAEVAWAIQRGEPQANQTLRKLMEHGLVERRADERRPARFLYFAKEMPSPGED